MEINAEKTKYMIMSRHQNSGQNRNIRIANESFENLENFRYLRTKPINQKFRECLLSFSPKPFVFPSYIKKPKD
jgi:hypothetical protein